ncbi:hypothetical protein [Micromonospora sp. NPDC050276]|uniref:hypothetical protein n=1 Tax=Micromonospora sp. NPDC050276 TaxID=3364278 RepID=UPI003799D640
MRCLVEDLATFAWLRREPVPHNVLRTLVADRLSGDVPLSGDERRGRGGREGRCGRRSWSCGGG